MEPFYLFYKKYSKNPIFIAKVNDQIRKKLKEYEDKINNYKQKELELSFTKEEVHNKWAAMGLTKQEGEFILRVISVPYLPLFVAFDVAASGALGPEKTKGKLIIENLFGLKRKDLTLEEKRLLADEEDIDFLIEEDKGEDNVKKSINSR